MNIRFQEWADLLQNLLNNDPPEAVRKAREIDLSIPEPGRTNWMNLRASTLVDGGAMTNQQDAVEEGVDLFRGLQSRYPTAGVTYNLGNGLAALAGNPPSGAGWLTHQEQTRGNRAEARRCFWEVSRNPEADLELKTQAWTNLGNQLSKSFRLGEAHDAWREALAVDPSNGVAAFSAAKNLLWLDNQVGCSEVTYIEAIMLAKIAQQNIDRITQYAGMQAANEIAAFAEKLDDVPTRSVHMDPFISWVERERLTRAPAVELVDPSLGKLDWLTLPGILERQGDRGGMPPPVFAMFNVLKSDFILARDLAWKALDERGWPETGAFGDTLDCAIYGPNSSAFTLAHRTALDLLDKIAVTANHYFEFGKASDKVWFHNLWRSYDKHWTGPQPLAPEVEKVIQEGVSALYGLVELADDYGQSNGILRSHKDLRNASTHRFVVLHDFGDLTQIRRSTEVEHHLLEPFVQELLRALRVARSAIQMLAFSISQREKVLQKGQSGRRVSLIVPDHDRIRGRVD